MEYYIDDVSSDDEWITEKEEPDLPPQKEWMHSFNSSARSEAAIGQRR